MIYPAPLPSPQYIDWENNVRPYIEEKISVGEINRTQVPLSVVNQLIAVAEQIVLQDLSPYYVTTPHLVTVDNIPWTDLTAYGYGYTYSMLYYAFINMAAYKIIGNFLTKNGDEQGNSKGLAYFLKYYQNEYAQFLNRLHDLLPNGGYRYDLPGLMPNPKGIPRRMKSYAYTGELGNAGYSDDQVTNASLNWANAWGRDGRCFNRDGSYEN